MLRAERAALEAELAALRAEIDRLRAEIDRLNTEEQPGLPMVNGADGWIPMDLPPDDQE